MKKIVLLVLLFTLALSAMAQKRVAVYVDGDDPKVKDYVAGEMVKVISQSRKYTAVNRSDDFSKQLQNERSYQQSGMVDDRQIAQLGKESGVVYVCAIKIMEVAHGEYSMEARLIDVETGDIKASDRRSSDVKHVEMAIRKIGSTITNFESKSYRNGFLQYSERARTKIVLNDFGEEKELKLAEIRSLLVANPDAYDLYEKGINILDNLEGFDITKFFWGFLTLCGATGVILTSPIMGGEDWNPTPCVVVGVATGVFASQWVYKIAKPKIGVKKIKKAIGLYNNPKYSADNLDFSVGFGMNSIGLTLNF